MRFSIFRLVSLFCYSFAPPRCPTTPALSRCVRLEIACRQKRGCWYTCVCVGGMCVCQCTCLRECGWCFPLLSLPLSIFASRSWVKAETSFFFVRTCERSPLRWGCSSQPGRQGSKEKKGQLRELQHILPSLTNMCACIHDSLDPNELKKELSVFFFFCVCSVSFDTHTLTDPPKCSVFGSCECARVAKEKSTGARRFMSINATLSRHYFAFFFSPCFFFPFVSSPLQNTSTVSVFLRLSEVVMALNFPFGLFSVFSFQSL